MVNKYITKSEQNIYDIALEIYGSVEGVFDLLLSNENISFDTVLTKNTKVFYHSGFELNKNIVNWLKNNKVTVRNGNYKILSTNVREQIIEWVAKTNSQKFSTSITDKTGDMIAPPNLWLDSEVIGVSDDETPATEQNSEAQVTEESLKDEWTIGVKDNFDIDIDTFGKSQQAQFLDKWYAQGMIVVPSKKEERDAYYDHVSLPKIKIAQAGNSSSIRMQVPANRFVAIDWGDGTDLDFVHYTKKITEVSHTYEDFGEHEITIYGHNDFTHLDFMKLGGVYYALSDIHVTVFKTPYTDETTLNKLFITHHEQKH